MERKRKKINNADEMIDALVEDYFRYDDLPQMEAEAIRHNCSCIDLRCKRSESERIKTHKTILNG